jgi:hypothetical protein
LLAALKHQAIQVKLPWLVQELSKSAVLDLTWHLSKLPHEHVAKSLLPWLAA